MNLSYVSGLLRTFMLQRLKFSPVFTDFSVLFLAALFAFLFILSSCHVVFTIVSRFSKVKTEDGKDDFHERSFAVIGLSISFLSLAVLPVDKGFVISNLDSGLRIFAVSLIASDIIWLFQGFRKTINGFAVHQFTKRMRLLTCDLSVVLAVCGAATLARTQNLGALIEAQTHMWYVIPLISSFIIYCFCAGIGIDGHGKEKATAPIIQSYVRLFVLASFGTALFLGGWQVPFVAIPMPSILVMLLKIYIVFIGLILLNQKLTPRIEGKIIKTIIRYMLPIAAFNYMLTIIGIKVLESF